MGRMLGAYDSEELDRPDLNKCPDCGCFFAQENCPLCGKLCPDEMRAGNRKPVKKRKKRSDVSDRVIFVQWYHSWWVIAVAMVFMPIVGIALLLTSPHKRSAKAVFGAVAAIYLVISTFGLGTIIDRVTGIFDKPVDTSLSRDEYTAISESVSPADFYRYPDEYNDRYISMKLRVVERIVDAEGYSSGEKYTVYYICTDTSGSELEILVRDCIQDEKVNLLPNDIITVYGEGRGELVIYDLDYAAHSAPCINVAYIDK